MRLLAGVVAAAGVAHRWPVFVLDAANLFDPYLVVREGRRRGLPPAPILEQIQVARAFTCHQLVQLLRERLPAVLPGHSPALLLLLGPCSLFYDEQIPLPERRRLFRTLVTSLAALKPRVSLWLLQPSLPPFVANQHFGRLLRPLAEQVLRTENFPGVRAGLRRAAATYPPAGILQER